MDAQSVCYLISTTWLTLYTYVYESMAEPADMSEHFIYKVRPAATRPSIVS
jgi:hypothetical protein